jgi:hypothetical protein
MRCTHCLKKIRGDSPRCMCQRCREMSVAERIYQFPHVAKLARELSILLPSSGSMSFVTGGQK